MAIRMQQRRGTAAQWISLNEGDGPILGAGEIGFESDTGKFKIGDGTNHWVDLDYFLDASDLSTSLGGYIPDSLLGAADGVAQLNSSGKLVSTQIPNVDEITQDAINTALTAGTGITKTYDDNANTITVAVDTTAIQARVADVSDTEIGYLNGVTSSIQTQLDNKLASADLTEAAQDAVNTAIVAGTGLDKTYDDAGNTITLDIDSTVATKSFAAGLLTNATKSNITITGDADGLTITAENGVADSNTDNLTEGTTNKYFTDERAQDAIGSNVGTGLSYNDTTGAISVDTTAIQARVADVSDTEIGYLNGVTSAIQTQIDGKSATGHGHTASNISDFNEAAQDAIGSILGTGLSYNDAGPGIGINNAALSDYLLDGVSGSSYGLIGTSAYLDIKNTNGYNKEIELDIAAVESKLETDGFAKLASPTFTGTVTLAQAPSSDLHAATKLYVDNVTAGINFHEAVHAASTVNSGVIYNNGTSGVGATLTADTNRAISSLDGESVAVGQRILMKDQTDQKQNGIYTLTDAGSVSAPWVMTRAIDADNNPSGEIKNGDFVLVINGATNAGYGYINNSATNPIVIGTDNITYVPFNAGKTVVAGTGLTESTPGTIAIDTATTVDKTTAQTLTNKTISGADNTLTVRLGNDVSGTLPVANGGTGATTASTAAAALLPAQASNSGKYLTTDGSGTLSWGTVSGYSAPTLGSTSIASGATVTTIAGLTLTSPVATTSLTLNDRAELRLADTDSTHYVGFKSPATVSTNRIWTLPSVDGTAGQVLSTDGSATLSWATAAAGGGGADEVKLVMGAY
jgi:hypothetical protein